MQTTISSSLGTLPQMKRKRWMRSSETSRERLRVGLFPSLGGISARISRTMIIQLRLPNLERPGNRSRRTSAPSFRMRFPSESCPYACSSIDAGIKWRPKPSEVAELGPEFRDYWNSYFANASDKPVLCLAISSMCVIEQLGCPNTHHHRYPGSTEILPWSRCANTLP